MKQNNIILAIGIILFFWLFTASLLMAWYKDQKRIRRFDTKLELYDWEKEDQHETNC